MPALKTKYASKQSLNMAVRERNYKETLKLLAGLAVIALLCAVVIRFAVELPFSQLTKARNNYTQAASYNRQLLDILEDYPDVLKEYRSLSLSWLEEDEMLVDRQKVLDLVERELMPNGEVLSVEIYNDSVEVSMSGMDLEAVSEMFLVLRKDPIVEHVSLNSAVSDKSVPEHGLDFNFTIELRAAETEAAQ